MGGQTGRRTDGEPHVSTLDVGKVLDYFGVQSLAELTSRAASRCIKSLEKNRRAA